MRAAFLLSASALALAAGPAAAADGDISSVLLSSGGLAEIVRGFEADGPAAIEVTVPATQVDDVLKSLVVADPAGTVTGVSLVGSDSVAEAFRNLPFGPGDLASPAAVAQAMRGFTAEVDDGEGNAARGVILGVDRVQRPSEGAAFELPAVSLLLADGSVRQLTLGPAAKVTFTDAGIRQKIAEAGRALRGGKDDGAKTVRVETEGAGPRRVEVSYVAAAPVWKVAYRAIAGADDKVRIQGWAVLENATGEDWDDVTVTLSSSNPVALRQRLYDMYWRPRAEAPIALPGGPVNVGIDDGALQRTKPAGEDFAYEASDMEMPAAAAPPRSMQELASIAGFAQRTRVEPSAPTQQVTAVEGDVGVRFTIPRPVDLPSGHTLSVPIIDADYEAELVSLWQPSGGSRHPVAALFLTNGGDGSLPPGIFTVFDEEGYLGDAQILGIPPGETRFAAYAADPKVTVDTDGGETRRIASARVENGVLVLTRRFERTTDYDIEGPETAARTVMIDHPRQLGWDARSETEVVSDNGSSMRLKTRLEPGATATVRVLESRLGEEQYMLLEQDYGALVAWSETRGIDPAIREKLAGLAERRRALAEAEDEVERIATAFQRLDADQDRVRRNLQSVPSNSELARTYLEAMAELDGRLAEAAKRREAAERTVEELRTAYEEAVAAL